MVSVLSSKLQQIKDKFLSMDIESKRRHYLCHNDFVRVEGIPTWGDYAKERNLKTTLSQEYSERAILVDEEINSKVSLWQGDITRLEIDAVVNAANSSLLGGGGVDGRIHEAAGEDLVHECEALNGCEVGKAKITGGYKLPAKYVFHTVGPQDHNHSLLRSAYESCLALMINQGFKTIAFSCISTGIYGYPIEDASHVALLTARKFLEANKSKIDRIIFTTYKDEDRKVYEELMLRYFPIE